jgi:hypothetical protein
MVKVSFTILKPANGSEPKVLACSEDAQVALCEEAGEVQFMRKVVYDKRKVNVASPVAKKKAVKKA